MKTRLLMILTIVTLGVFQTHESFSEDYFSTPSCNKGVFSSDHVQCSTLDLPPCPEPSFEKNGYCVVKKMDVCEQGTVLKYGDCVPDTSVGDYDIAKQHMQTGETISESGALTSIIIGGLGPILILFFIILYAIKKRSDGKKKRHEK